MRPEIWLIDAHAVARLKARVRTGAPATHIQAEGHGKSQDNQDDEGTSHELSRSLVRHNAYSAACVAKKRSIHRLV